MKEIIVLESLGYVFSVQDKIISISYNLDRPELEVVQPLLEVLRIRKAETLKFLHQREF